MRERHQCTIFKLYTSSFCRQKAGLEVLVKAAEEQIDGKEYTLIKEPSSTNRESTVITMLRTAFNSMITVDSPFLPKATLLSIYPLLKPVASKLLTLPSADKKNWCTLFSLKIVH